MSQESGHSLALGLRLTVSPEYAVKLSVRATVSSEGPTRGQSPSKVTLVVVGRI